MIGLRAIRRHLSAPGSPTALTMVSSTTTSITVGWAPPSTGGNLNNGSYVLQYRKTGTTTFTSITMPYCTPNSGSITTPNSSVWRIANGSAQNQILINNVVDSPTNSVVELISMPDNNIWQVNTSGNWYAESNTSTATSDTWVLQGTTSPITLGVTITSLSTSQSYDFRVSVSNSSGSGPNTAIQAFSTSASTVGLKLYGGNFGFPGAAPDPTNASTWESTQGQNPALLGGISFYSAAGTIDTWPNFALSALQNMKASSNVGERNAIPSLSIGMNDGSVSKDQAYTNIVNGVWDSYFTGILQSAKTAGYNTVYVRPAWEFNGSWYVDWYPNGNYTGFVAAFKHLYTIWHNWASANGTVVKVCWNPAQGGDQMSIIQQCYPGNAFVDVVTFDAYGPGSTGHPTSESTDMSILSIQWMMEYAAQLGMPFGLDETGADRNDNTYPGSIAQAMQNANAAFPGAVIIDHIITWDRDDGNTAGPLDWSNGPATTSAAWLSAINTVMSLSA